MFIVELRFKISDREVPLERFAEILAKKVFGGSRQEIQQLRVPVSTPAAGVSREQRQMLGAVSIDQAAELVSLSKWTVRKYVQEGRIQAIRAGRRILIPMESMEKFITEGTGPLKGR